MIKEPIHISEEISALKIESKAFADRTYIPAKYTYDGEDVNPPLTIKNVPQKAKSLALIIDDADAPGGNWVHWLVWNIPVSGRIYEDMIPGEEGMNSFRKNHYGGPCPPTGTHKYHFKVYALDEMIDLKTSATKEDLEKAMAPHVVGFGELIGLYKRAL